MENDLKQLQDTFRDRGLCHILSYPECKCPLCIIDAFIASAAEQVALARSEEREACAEKVKVFLNQRGCICGAHYIFLANDAATTIRART